MINVDELTAQLGIFFMINIFEFILIYSYLKNDFKKFRFHVLNMPK